MRPLCSPVALRRRPDRRIRGMVHPSRVHLLSIGWLILELYLQRGLIVGYSMSLNPGVAELHGIRVSCFDILVKERLVLVLTELSNIERVDICSLESF